MLRHTFLQLALGWVLQGRAGTRGLHLQGPSRGVSSSFCGLGHLPSVLQRSRPLAAIPPGLFTRALREHFAPLFVAISWRLSCLSSSLHLHLERDHDPHSRPNPQRVCECCRYLIASLFLSILSSHSLPTISDLRHGLSPFVDR